MVKVRSTYVPVFAVLLIFGFELFFVIVLLKHVSRNESKQINIM